MAYYISTPDYDRLVDALANLKPCPFEGRITADQIKIALGELGDVWPASILPDVLQSAERIDDNIVRLPA